MPTGFAVFVQYSIGTIYFAFTLQEWAEDDVESDNWHEDTYEWRQKDQKKKQKPFDPKNPDAFLAQAMSGSGMQMLFVTLKEEFHQHKDQTAELAVKWQSETGCPSFPFFWSFFGAC